MVSLDRSNRSCNTFDDSPARICVTNKTEYVNLNVCNVTTRINESKTLTKYVIVHSNLMVEFVIQVKSGKTINENVTVKNSIKDHVCKEDYAWNPSTCVCEINYAYMRSLIIADSVATCHEILDEVAKGGLPQNNLLDVICIVRLL